MHQEYSLDNPHPGANLSYDFMKSCAQLRLRRVLGGALGILGWAATNVPAATGTIQDVQHVAILALENRSFDHYFGAMKAVRGFDDRTALLLPTGNSIFAQPYGSGVRLPFHTTEQCLVDEEHSWPGQHTVWNLGKWDQWAAFNGPNALEYYTRDDLPFHYALADAYTICDNYFCSVIGPTWPNRAYLMTGTIDPSGTGGGPMTDNTAPTAGYTWTTYPERLQTNGVSWKVYQEADNYGCNVLEWFAPFISAAPGSPLHNRGMARVTNLVTALRTDVTNATLPQVSWIVLPSSFTEHPPYSAASGQFITKQILEALAANPTVFHSTVLIITYDENGGFFNHVPPPTPPPGTPDEFVGGQPIGLGSRVPLILVSPWTRGGYVCSEVFDHTSIIRFLEKWTGVAEPNISAWRRQLCGDLTAAFDFANPSTNYPSLPAVAPITCAVGHPVTPPAIQSMPTQEGGIKLARPLPYQPNANSDTDCATGQFRITMTNAGTAALHFAIYANAFRLDGPWQYDVAPGGSGGTHFQIATNGSGPYDFSCYGPNGFLRRFAGNGHSNCNQLEVTSTIDPPPGSIAVVMKNATAGAATFTITNSYVTNGAASFIVPADSTAMNAYPVLADNHGWYDLTVTTDDDPAFLRRLAGHIENGSVTLLGRELPPSGSHVTELSASLRAGNIVLTYPGSFTNHTLQSSPSLPASWTPVGITPTNDFYSNNVVTLPITTNSMYFRLQP